MELLETQDPEKKKLIETSNRHRYELEREMDEMGARSQKILKNALIIGGALALTYILVSQMSSRKSKKKKAKAEETEAETKQFQTQKEDEDNEPSIFSEIGGKVATAATVFLLDLAKEKLADYLQNRSKTERDTNRQ
jgi:hypothetical protein